MGGILRQDRATVEDAAGDFQLFCFLYDDQIGIPSGWVLSPCFALLPRCLVIIDAMFSGMIVCVSGLRSNRQKSQVMQELLSDHTHDRGNVTESTPYVQIS